MKEHGEVFTPKEYAEWLVNEYNDLGKDFTRGTSMIEFSKQCALISVHESIMSTRILVNHYIKTNGVKAYMDIELSKNLTLAYYNEVKQEIEKL